MKSIARIVLLSTVLLIPLVASAAFSIGGGGVSNTGSFLGVSVGSGNSGVGFGGFGCSFTICGVGGTIIYIINSILVPVLFALAFIVFLYGVAKAYIFSHGDPERVKAGHTLVLYGIIGFVIMLSLWGLVNIVASTFGLSGAVAPPTPTSYSGF